MDAPAAETAYMFTHALLQRGCYELMLPSVRGELHRRALGYLETHKLATPEELAGHALAGQVGAPPTMIKQLKAMRIGFLREGVEQATSIYANERALALLNELFACEGLGDTDCIELRRRKADLLNRTGRMEDAVVEAELALDSARASGNDTESAKALLMLACCCMDTSHNARTPQLLDEAIASFRQLNDTAMLEQALSALARALFTSGRTEEALEPAQHALKLAETLADDIRIARCRLLIMTVLAQLSRNDEALKYAESLVPVLKNNPNPGTRCVVAAGLASLSHGLGRFEESAEYHALASKEAAAGGLHAEVARAEVNLGGIALQLRRFHAGLRHVETAEAMARELGNQRVLWFALRNRYEIYDAVGDFRSALQAATSAARVAEAASMAWHYLVSSAQAAAAFLELGQADDALECIDAALKAPRAGQFLHFVLAKLQAQRACAQFRIGRHQAAQEALGEMEHFLTLAGSEPGPDSQRWIQEARSLKSA
jgi:tetratricopeptide (TPR) repeat protein